MLTTKVLFLGIDAVGKTSLLYKLKLNENIQTIPTIGFNVESIEYKNRKFYMWDIGGGCGIKNFWSHYMKNSNCLIFVIDISTKDRINEYIESFQFLLDQHKDIRNIPIIIFNNKKNDKKEFESEEILKKVNMPPEIAPQILEGNVFSGEGLPELLEYIYNNIEFKEEIIKEEEENEKKEKNEEKEENENKNEENENKNEENENENEEKENNNNDNENDKENNNENGNENENDNENDNEYKEDNEKNNEENKNGDKNNELINLDNDEDM
jgi:ADP-ribosylation factor protein 1